MKDSVIQVKEHVMSITPFLPTKPLITCFVRINFTLVVEKKGEKTEK